MNVLPFLQDMSAGLNARGTGQQTQAGESGWQRAMERAEAQAWLLHPVVEHQRSIAIFGSSTYLTKTLIWRDSNQQSESFENFSPKQEDRQEHMSDSSGSPKYPQLTEEVNSTSSYSQTETQIMASSVTDTTESDMGIDRSMQDLFIQKLNLLLSGTVDSETVKRDERTVASNGSYDLSRHSKEFRAKLQISPTSTSVAGQDLRLYIEWSAQGIHVWLGVDAKDEAIIPQLAKYLLRRLSENGLSVIALICNGKIVYENPIEVYESENRARTADIESRV